jgi:hypothetical protein
VETAADRTNLAVLNAGRPGDGEICFHISVISTDSTHPGSFSLPEIRLGPGEFHQINRVLSATNLGATSGFARVEPDNATLPYLAYAVVNDSITSDGSINPAGSFYFGEPLFLPVGAEAGPYVTELSLVNFDDLPVRVALSFPVTPRYGMSFDRASLEIDLPPQSAQTFPDFFEEVRRRGLAGPKGPAIVGPILVNRVWGSLEAGQRLWIGARVLNSAPGGGRYGVSIPVVTSAMSSAETVLISDLRQDEATRTNLAISSVGYTSVVFRIEIFDGDTGQQVATLDDISVPFYGWRQFNSILSAMASGTRHGYCRVTRVSGGPFVAYAVINDGARPGEGTGDGSFILGRPEQ